MSEGLPVDMGGTDTQPAKVRIEPAPVAEPVVVENGPNLPAEVVVLKEKPGEVTVVDKAKAYYHTLSVVIAGILVTLNELTPLTDVFGSDFKRGLTIATIICTAVFNAIKSNEVWVNKP